MKTLIENFRMLLPKFLIALIPVVILLVLTDTWQQILPVVIAFFIGYVLAFKEGATTMTYAENIATEILNMPQTLNRPENVRQMTIIVEKIMQTQRRIDVHDFQETLKEHGVGGLQYDAIMESINEKVEA